MCNAVTSPCLQQWPKQLNTDISEVDPEIVDIIEREKNRQWKVLYTLYRIIYHIVFPPYIAVCGVGLSRYYTCQNLK